jgi:translation initiation factor 3 subunit I
MIVYSTDQAMSKPCEIFIADVRDPSQLGASDTKATIQDSKVTSLIWGAVDETVVTGHENGRLTLWDLKVKIKSFLHHSIQTKNIFFRQ